MSLKQTQNKLRELYSRRGAINKEIDEVYTDLLERIPFKFKITDHAVVEYLKDFELVPVSEARFKMLSAVETFFDEHPNINPETLKDTHYKLRVSGIIYVIHNYTIVTCYADE